jgi:hypothetical protein
MPPNEAEALERRQERQGRRGLDRERVRHVVQRHATGRAFKAADGAQRVDLPPREPLERFHVADTPQP